MYIPGSASICSSCVSLVNSSLEDGIGAVAGTGAALVVGGICKGAEADVGGGVATEMEDCIEQEAVVGK